MKTPLTKKETSNIPLELLKEVYFNRNAFTIGIPKETGETEKRLALTPEAVDMLTEMGFCVFVEEGAGIGINYSDAAYSEAGADICNRETAFAADLIMKIAPPTDEEIALMKRKATVCSALDISRMSVSTISAMSDKMISAIGYELMNDGQTFPVRNAISEIEGVAAISVASEFLSNEHGGKGVLLGGVPGVSPTEIVIIGAGVAGTIAARAALALGATVKIFDNDIMKLRKLQNDLGLCVFTSVLHPNVLINAFKSADVVIGAMRYINNPVRQVISEDVVMSMKKGALIIDLRVNQGGCFETTCYLPEEHPCVFEKHDVIHYCKPNVSSRVARTTSMSLSNIFTPMLIGISEHGGIMGSAKTNPLFRSGLYMYSGKLVNSYVARYFNQNSNDIDLYLAIF